MSLFRSKKKNEPEPAPAKSEERVIPKSDIKYVYTFTQAKSFRGFRRVGISFYGLDGVDKNLTYFGERDYDFTNSAVQIMIVKANNDVGVCLRIVVDGKFIGNVYKNSSNAEAFDAALDKKLDKAYVKIEDTVIDGKYYGTEAFIMLHWPDMGPRVKIEVK